MRPGTLAHIARWCVTIALVVPPLVVNPWSLLPYDIDKNSMLRAAVVAGVFVLLVLAVWFRAGLRELVSERHLSPVDLFLLVGLTLTALSAALSPELHDSVFGSFDRRMGLLFSVHLALAYLLCRIFLTDDRSLTRVLKLLALAGIATSAYAMLQVFNIDVPNLRDPFPLVSAPGWFRTVGTLGQPNFLGALLVMTLPFATLFAARAHGRGRVAWVCGSLLIAIALASTFSRGAWVGTLAVGAVIFIRSKDRKRIGAVVLLIALALIPFFGAIRDRLSWSGVNADSTNARLIGWKAATTAIAIRPVLGWGPEGYINYTASHLDRANPDYPFAQDRAHNLFLDSALVAGFPGLVITLATIGFVLTALWRSRSPLATAFSAAAIGYLVQNQFNFDVTGTSTVPVLLLSVAATWSERRSFARFADFLPKGGDLVQTANGVAVIVGMAIVVALTLPPTLAGIFGLNAIHAAYRNDIPTVVRNLNRSVRLDPYQGEYRTYLERYSPAR